ncbi:MAG: tetratricopeptide repeat protein [Porphyromonadaceae bacterium]|nr:tetratricopeptide repeat protein [Porphyromonadaceae bacterium]
MAKLKKIVHYVNLHGGSALLISNKIASVVLVLLACHWIGYTQEQKPKSNSTDQYQALIDSSFLYGDARKYAEAERSLKRAIELNPRHPLNALLLNNLGGIQELQQKYNEALLSYSAALELNSDDATTRANRAKLFVTLGNLKAALTDYSILVSQEASNEVYRYQRAMTYILNKEYDLAEADLMTIVDNNSESLKPRIGLALLKTMQREYDEAERLYDNLLIRLPKSAEVYEGRARLYLARGMKGYALRDVNKAFELSGPSISAPLYRLRAEILTAMSERKSAAQDFETANKLEPQNPRDRQNKTDSKQKSRPAK